MSKSIKRRGLVLGVVLALAVAGAAVAYWTAGGSGTGSGSAAGAQSGLTAHQTTTLTAMYPGDTPGNFDNPNSGPIRVSTVTASIASVTKASGAPAGTCDATDFTLANATMTVDAEIATGTGKGAFTGATINFNNKPTNQDACKGATVNFGYAIA